MLNSSIITESINADDKALAESGWTISEVRAMAQHMISKGA